MPSENEKTVLTNVTIIIIGILLKTIHGERVLLSSSK